MARTLDTTTLADEALIAVLVRREPEMIAGEHQAYKRGVIRMVLRHMAERRAALDELTAMGWGEDT